MKKLHSSLGLQKFRTLEKVMKKKKKQIRVTVVSVL